MINTDKYEGHTPAPWLWCEDEGLDLVVADDQCRTVIEEVKALNTDADAQLIADAPLLLEEVKRLRKEINQLPIDLHESLDMILEAHHPEVRESVMSMFGDAWGNNLTGYEE